MRRIGGRGVNTASDSRAQHGTEGWTTTDCRGARRRALAFGPTASRGAQEASIRPPSSSRLRFGGGQRCVTPRQTCPRPNGFGRNLRSKTRWFTGFCNSHQVSHFATFFIDARAEISVAESRFDIKNTTQHPEHTPSLGRRGILLIRSSSLARFAPGFVCAAGKATPTRVDQRRPVMVPPKPRRSGALGPLAPELVLQVRGSFCCAGFRQ